MKVNFMIIGAMKCGTSTLAKILSDHPWVSFCEIKEPHFFSQTPDWRNNIDLYHKMFKHKEGVIYGEGSTSYTFTPVGNFEIWKNIYQYNPDMKFIYMVRNPIDRLISHYTHMYERGYLSCNIDSALETEHGLLTTGCYYTQIMPYIRQFGKEKVLLIDFDDFNQQREKVMEKVFNFLNIQKTEPKEALHLHENKSIGSFKLNYKVEKVIKRFTGFIPIKTKRLIFDMLFSGIGSRLKEKPILGDCERQMLNNYYFEDNKALAKNFNIDIVKWT